MIVENSKPRAEAQRRQSTGQLREAQSREGIREVEKGKLAWDERGWKQRERSRAVEGTVKLKILGIWVVLFVLICDCFVINPLDWICSLSGWFLVCLEDNNVIFGQWFCLEPMFNWICQNFCFLVKRMCQIFEMHLKLFFFFAPTTPYFLKFWSPLPLGSFRL